MVMKKIIAFIICLALCVSGLAVGVMNQEAKNGAEVLGAANNAVIGAGSEIDIVAGNAAGAPQNSYKDPSGVTTNPVGKDKDGVKVVTSPADSIVEKDGNWYLTGNVTVDSVEDIAELKAALATDPDYGEGGLNKDNCDANAESRVTLDGQGYTLTTSIPLFDVLTSCIIKDITIAGTINATNADVYGYDADTEKALVSA